MSELEEAAREYIRQELERRNYINFHGSTHVENSFLAGAEWQAKQSPWISVEDRLPEDGLIDPIAWNVTNSVVALTSNGNAIVTKRRWNCTLKTWEWKGSHTFVNSIVKWMPIPESP